MALKSYTVSVNGTTSTLLAAVPLGGGGKLKVYVANWSGTDHLYVGNSTVSVAEGYEIPSFNGNTVSNRQEFELFAGDALYAIAPPAKTIEARVLITGL